MVGGETAAPWGKRGSYFLAVPTADMRLRPSPQPIAAKRTTPVRAALLDRRPGSAEDLGRGRLTAGPAHSCPGLGGPPGGTPPSGPRPRRPVRAPRWHALP